MTAFKENKFTNEVDFDIGIDFEFIELIDFVVSALQEVKQHLLVVVEYSVDFQNEHLYFQIHSIQLSMNEIVLTRQFVLNSLIQILEFEDVLLMIEIRSVAIECQLLSIHGNMDDSDIDEHCISHLDHIIAYVSVSLLIQLVHSSKVFSTKLLQLQGN
ncbi:MAG: hypothetical protein EZS28_013463 [Streblomastix strix]|uniref:Uncharacterized protein n=1 Tax=Streblomastix strix TaxID=222440 RepID=A0A5J4W7W5_9EUKA|nr:MAG: hypothetical protein EZS28_013463 [Streblomastix strix]